MKDSTDIHLWFLLFEALEQFAARPSSEIEPDRLPRPGKRPPTPSAHPTILKITEDRMHMLVRHPRGCSCVKPLALARGWKRIAAVMEVDGSHPDATLWGDGHDDTVRPPG